MTDQEREISHMEKMIREFRIVGAGTDIQGRFGSLPKSDDTVERIKNIKRSIAKFYVEVTDLKVQGSFDDGFTLS